MEPENYHKQTYINDAVTYTTPQDIVSNCAQITFYNNAGTGGASIVILGITLTPGQGIAFSGNDGELDVTKYYLTFTGAGNKSCAVIRKNYRL